MESTALRAAPQNNHFDSLKARVVTKAFGLRIGAFGVDYTSKSVEVDPDQQQAAGSTRDSGSRQAAGGASTPERDTRAQAFQTEMERETLRRQVYGAPYRQAAQTGPASPADTAAPDPSPSSQAFSNHPDPVWRRGLAAYAQARQLLRSDAQRMASTRLAVA